MHYAQMMAYMGLADLERALYLSVNKDTDELYSERIEYKASEFKAIMARAERIIKAPMPCERCTQRPDDFRCNFCDVSELCWGNMTKPLPLPAKTCRTCCHATPEVDKDETWARWSCACHKRDISFDEQLKACGKHLLIPGLIPFATPVDSGEDFIVFENADDKTRWTHGNAEGLFSTDELMKIPATTIPVVAQAKQALGATVTGFEVPALTLIERYDPKDSRLVWEGKPSDCPRQDGKITGVFKDAKHIAEEYDGKWLRVEYVGSDYAAIWEGVE